MVYVISNLILKYRTNLKYFLQSVVLPESDRRRGNSPLTVGLNYYSDDHQLLMKNKIEEYLDNGEMKRFNTRLNGVQSYSTLLIQRLRASKLTCFVGLVH